MPKITSIETETDVKRLSKENYSKTDIKHKLKEDIDINIKTITRILKNVGIRRQALSAKKSQCRNLIANRLSERSPWLQKFRV